MEEAQAFSLFDGTAPTLHCLLMGAYFPRMSPAAYGTQGSGPKFEPAPNID